MTIPTNFPAHWVAAIETGKVTFRDRDDAVAFFAATDGRRPGCLQDLEIAHALNVVALREQHRSEFMACRGKRSGKSKDAVVATPASVSVSWDKIIEKINARFPG
jgi:hypothetical protein